MGMATVAIIGTCDTKLDELLFMRDRILDNTQVNAILIDVGWKQTNNEAITTTPQQLTSIYGHGRDIFTLPRGKFIEAISNFATQHVKSLFEKGQIHGIVHAGGSGGTSLAAAVMRDALPVGFPKLIVSTIASGDTTSIVGESDITLMYSVVDVAGLNRLLRDVLSNAGTSIAAASHAYATRQKGKSHQPPAGSSKKRVGITMFGVTTPGVDAIRKHLESQYPIETYIFHATGSGGRAMERLVREGELDAVLDLTTTEVCDLVMGGIMSAGENRLSAALEAGIPNIVSLGATDMANFGPRGTVPDKYGNRKIHEHNPLITLVRPSKDDCKQIGGFICSKLKKAKVPQNVQLWIPNGGVSMLSVPNGPFADKTADEALFSTIRKGLEGTDIKVVEDTRDVNEENFAKHIADALAAKMDLA